MVNNPILSLAIVFILGFFASRLAKKLKIPTITAYVILGILFSPSLLNLLSKNLLEASGFFSNVVLGMIAFSLGESFSLGTLRRVGRAVTGISISASVVPWFLVTLAVRFIFNQPFSVALIFGAIAAATAPAAVVMVTQEYKSKGDFTDTLLGVVAIDDAWALMIFGFSLALAKTSLNGNGSALHVIKDVGWASLEIAGSLGVGALVAVIFGALSKFVNTMKDRLIYTLGFLFFAIGVSMFFHLSVLLSCIFFGAMLTNTNRISFEFFNSLREIDSPLYLIFFVLAGASLKISVLGTAISLTIGYIVFRSLGKIIGAFLGAKIIDTSLIIKKYMGIALIPQAGVALACALVAKDAIGGSWGDKILTITIASTVIFELIGPWATKFALVRSGEIQEQEI
ncbi:MAG: cation:proton antiporter [Candidatus Omnitrophica bacterium]|nr:cation:proton antiporter [Candidatus Omnitrophota bacterium]